jgi:hypothetical protein
MKLEYLNMHEHREGFMIAGLLGTKGNKHVERMNIEGGKKRFTMIDRYEISIIRETQVLNNKECPVFWVDVFKNWIEDNDRALDGDLTKMYKTLTGAINYIDRIFNIPNSIKKLIDEEPKHIIRRR